MDHHSSVDVSQSIRSVDSRGKMISQNRSSFTGDSVLNSTTPTTRQYSVMDKALELSTLVSHVCHKPTSAKPFDQSFCGPVYDGDSDFEPSLLNSNYGLSRQEISRRKTIFENNIQTQFQLLKVNNYYVLSINS